MTTAPVRNRTSRRAAGVAAALLVSACTPKPASNVAADSGGGSSASAVPLPAAPREPAGDVARDTGAVARLEREARALARTEGCAAAGQCRVAPVGHRACGGPRDYVAYCPATTDSAALFRKLDELARAEEAEQSRTGMVSTCEFRTPPAVTASAGRCATSTGSDHRGRSTLP